MQRRDFLKFLRKPAVLVVAAVPVISTAANAAGSAAADDHGAAAALRGQVSALKERIDAMDKNYKRTLKAGAAVIAMLLGIDISSAL